MKKNSNYLLPCSLPASRENSSTDNDSNTGTTPKNESKHNTKDNTDIASKSCKENENVDFKQDVDLEINVDSFVNSDLYESEDDNEEDKEHRRINLRRTKVFNFPHSVNSLKSPPRVKYEDVENQLTDSFSKQIYYSSAFDIISTYIKGQKIIYTEAHEYATLYLNLLMLPAILLSAVASVFSFSFERYEWGPLVVASINAFNGFLLSVVSYSKLDAASEAHKISSHQYDKLQSMSEFTSGCLLILPFDKDNKNEPRFSSDKMSREKLEYIEGKIKDIKETNNFIIPIQIRENFRNIYYNNIFSLVKKVSETESIIIVNMKNMINQRNMLEYLRQIGEGTPSTQKEIEKITEMINHYHKDYIEAQSAYSQIDHMFKMEVREAQRRKRMSCCNRFFYKNEIRNNDEPIDEIEHINKRLTRLARHRSHRKINTLEHKVDMAKQFRNN